MQFNIVSTTADLQTLSNGKTAAATISAGNSISASVYNAHGGVLNPVSDSNGWYSFYCTGFRASLDTTAGLASFSVGNTIRWNAGVKEFASSSTTSTIYQSPVIATDFTYTIIDTATSSSAGLTLTAMTAVALIAFSI